MQLSEDEELGEEFEVIEKRECGVVHNGTVRRWWRGFRHLVGDGEGWVGRDGGGCVRKG
jgi:hypothetical protein